MRLTAKQLDRLRQIVVDHHAAFVANWIKPDLIPAKALARLRKLGLFKPKGETVKDAYLLGVLAARAKEGPVPDTYSQLRDRIKARPIPLSESEQHAIDVAEMSAGQYVTALGQRVAVQAGQMVLTQSERAAQEQRGAIAQTTAEAVEHRRTIKDLSSDLGHAIGDYTRDLERVANTELSAALNRGTAMAARKQEGAEVRAAVLCSPSCCDVCRRAYEEGGRPKTWLLSDLQANGTNVGRRAADSLAVVPPFHPNCFDGGTAFITYDGVKTLAETVGQEVKVLGHDGHWQDAKIVHFGKQPLKRLKLEKRGQIKVVLTTAEHRWFRRKTLDYGRHYSECQTHQLTDGDSLKSRLPSIHPKLHASPFGVCHGIVFGDGTRPKQTTLASQVTLYGDKIADLSRFFVGCKAMDEASKGGVTFQGMPRAWKDLPDLGEASSYLYGWLLGYFATDGSVGNTSNYTLSSKKERDLEFVQRVCLRLGIATSTIQTIVTTGFGDLPNRMHRLTFAASSLRPDFFLRQSHLHRFLGKKQKHPAEWRVVEVSDVGGEPQDVYCAVVPNGAAFTLADYIYTGNCACTLVVVPDGMHIDEAGDLVEDDGDAPEGGDEHAADYADQVQESADETAEDWKPSGE